MNKLKSIAVSLLILPCFMFIYSCDSGPDNDDIAEEEYKGAFEELEEDGKMKKSRRISVVREIIKTSQDDPDRMEVDRDKLGID